MDVSSEPSGVNCQYSGFKIESGLDINDNRNLESDEIMNTSYICHGLKLWRATTFLDLNGSVFGEEQNLTHGVVPSSATEGLVSAGTMPGAPVPAGTSGYLLLPVQDVPKAQYISDYYLTFDHWYHLDSSASGGGDGTWEELFYGDWFFPSGNLS